MKKIFLIIVVIFTFVLSGCSIDINNGLQKDDNRVEKQNITPNSGVYEIRDDNIPSYSEVTEDNVCVLVSNLVMKCTLEIRCSISYSYTYTYLSFYGRKSQTISDSTSSQATGFVINEDGYVLTNAHVVTLENEQSYSDLVYNDREIILNYSDSSLTFKATLIDYDIDLDLAILKMDTTGIENLKYVTFFDLTDPRFENYNDPNAIKLYYGETAIAIGNANGYGISVTKGVISAPLRIFINNNVSSNNNTYAIQTDAAINAGNSGGPLVNSYSAVIGINSFKIVTQTSEALGYAIPSYVILKYIDDFNNNNDACIKYYKTNERKFK